MKSLSDLLAPKQFSHLAGVPLSTLAYWRDNGYGPPFHKIGTRVYYDPGDWESWLASQRIGG